MKKETTRRDRDAAGLEGEEPRRSEASRASGVKSPEAHPARKSVTIFCDGSSLGNGQAMPRAAAVALLGYRGIWRGVGEFLGQATNQQAEIIAAALGLEALREPCSVRVVTDSRYVVETMSGRFRRKSNLEWWARLDKAARPHKINWEWAKGHAGHVIQEAADSAARRIAAAGWVDENILRDSIDRIGVAELDEQV
jgi:ribonuclease HI